MSSAAKERAERTLALPFETAGPRERGFFRGFLSTAADIYSHRELLGLLVRRELKSRYKDSRLGFVWSFIRPITLLLIYYIAIGQFLGAARNTPEFAIFVFSGLTIWGLFNEIVNSGTMSIIRNSGLIKKVYLPREIFPLSVVGSALFTFLVQFVILVVFTIALGQFPLSWTFLYVPAAILVCLIYASAFGVLLSALNVFLRDIQYLVEVGLLLLFWASPIVYPWATVVSTARDHGLPWLPNVYLLNPVADIIIAFQRGMWQAGSQINVIGEKVVAAQPWPGHMELRLLIIGVFGLVLLWVSQRIFARLQGSFAQEI